MNANPAMPITPLSCWAFKSVGHNGLVVFRFSKLSVAEMMATNTVRLTPGTSRQGGTVREYWYTRAARLWKLSGAELMAINTKGPVPFVPTWDTWDKDGILERKYIVDDCTEFRLNWFDSV